MVCIFALILLNSEGRREGGEHGDKVNMTLVMVWYFGKGQSKSKGRGESAWKNDLKRRKEWQSNGIK